MSKGARNREIRRLAGGNKKLARRMRKNYLWRFVRGYR
jgi:uncharacterized membrane protein